MRSCWKNYLGYIITQLIYIKSFKELQHIKIQVKFKLCRSPQFVEAHIAESHRHCQAHVYGADSNNVLPPCAFICSFIYVGQSPLTPMILHQVPLDFFLVIVMQTSTVSITSNHRTVLYLLKINDEFVALANCYDASYWVTQLRLKLFLINIYLA